VSVLDLLLTILSTCSQGHLTELEEERERWEQEKNELDNAKKELEQPETEAKESFKARWEGL